MQNVTHRYECTVSLYLSISSNSPTSSPTNRSLLIVAGSRMCTFRQSNEFIGETGETGLTGFERLGQKISEAFHEGGSGTYWHCKAYGPKDWGKTTAPTMASTGTTLSGYTDISFAHGKKGDIPIISNVLGNGQRAIMFDPSAKKWYAKNSGPAYWGVTTTDGAAGATDDHTINMCNALDVKAGAHTGNYLGLVNTPFWPLNYRPVQPSGGDYLSFVDMSTFVWYINWNPKRV